MTTLLVIGLLTAWLIVTVVLPIVSVVRVARVTREAELLRAQVAQLGRDLTRLQQERAPGLTSVERTEAPAAPAGVEAGTVAERETPADEGTSVSEPPPAARPGPSPAGEVPASPSAPRAHVSLEDRIGARWLLYVGMATLVLGVSYFIKYAFENNWVTPLMRVVLGAAGGTVLVEAGRRFSRRGLAFYGQMLAGGGIVVLYLAGYAAFSFYALLSEPAAFAWFVGVTAIAAVRAHRETSQGLALLAITGGFLTPFLVGGVVAGQHALFGYDAVLIAGTLWMARRHWWPGLHLVSLALTVLTVMAWADRYYVTTRWLSTELWLTLFVALFLLIRRALPAAATGTGRLARGVLAVTPLLYHAASLAILWPRTAGLLVYLIAATLAGIITSGHLGRAGMRLATWALVALPTLGWLATRPARWDTAPFVAIFAIYTLHLVAQLREVGPRREAPRPVEVALVHLNGLWLWGGLYLLLEKLALWQLGRVTFAVAAWYGLLAAAFIRRNRELGLHLVALASAFLAAGVAIEFDGAALTVAWAAEGAALVAVGLAVDRAWVRAAGVLLLALAVARLVSELVTPAPVSAVLVLNPRSLSALFVVALLGWLAWRHAGREAGSAGTRRAFDTLVVTGSLLLLLWATSEVTAWFARHGLAGRETEGIGAVTAAAFATQVTLSLLWAAYALALVAIGIRRRYRPLRLVAIVLFGVTVSKVFLVDLDQLDRFYRILSTVGLGLLLLGASYLYQRFTRQHAEDATSSTGTPASG